MTCLWRLTAVICLLFLPPAGFAQDLEPRRWNHLPVGLNVIGIGYARSQSDIFFSPALSITDGASDLNVWVVQYQRAFSLFGKSARVDVNLPYVSGHWEGIVGGEFERVSRRKGGDPRFRLSVNLLGAPALRGKDFSAYRMAHETNTVVGLSVAVAAPWGGYDPDQFINIGSNRWVVRPQLGVEHSRGPWIFELTGSVFLFTDNDEFLGDLKFEQEPFLALQSHITYSFPRGFWLTLGTAYGNGGEVDIEGLRTAYSVDNWIFGGSFGYSLTPSQSIRLTWTSGRTQNTVGRDFDSAVLSWSFKWLN